MLKRIEQPEPQEKETIKVIELKKIKPLFKWKFRHSFSIRKGKLR